MTVLPFWKGWWGNRKRKDHKASEIQISMIKICRVSIQHYVIAQLLINGDNVTFIFSEHEEQKLAANGAFVSDQ
jgi:hypothetical protein